MKIGDLIKVKQIHMDWASPGEIYGLITEIKKDFYSHPQGMEPGDPIIRSNQLVILWDHGGISSEPESYVEKVENEQS